MPTRSFIATAITAALLAAAHTAALTSAYAADMPDVIDVPDVYVEPEPVDAVDWTGAHAGASVIGILVDVKLRGLEEGRGTPFDEFPPIDGPSLDPRGAGVSVHGGFDYAFGAFVVGAELEAGYLRVKETKSVFARDRGPRRIDDDFAEIEFGAFGTASARVGAAFGQVLAYAKGGLAVSQVEGRFGDLDASRFGPAPDQGDLSIFDETLTGYLLGGGVEVAMTGGVSLKAEYNYIDLADFTSTNRDRDVFRIENDLHLLKVGLSARF